jgi:hypothetical protein
MVTYGHCNVLSFFKPQNLVKETFSSIKFDYFIVKYQNTIFEITQTELHNEQE